VSPDVAHLSATNSRGSRNEIINMRTCTPLSMSKTPLGLRTFCTQKGADSRSTLPARDLGFFSSFFARKVERTLDDLRVWIVRCAARVSWDFKGNPLVDINLNYCCRQQCRPSWTKFSIVTELCIVYETRCHRQSDPISLKFSCYAVEYSREKDSA